MLSRVPLFVTPWTVAHQALLSRGFSRQEYWSGLHFLLQGTFLIKGWNLILFHLLHSQMDFCHCATWEAQSRGKVVVKCVFIVVVVTQLYIQDKATSKCILYIYIHTHSYIYTHAINIYMYTHTQSYIYTHTIYIYTHTHSYIYMHTHSCIDVCVVKAGRQTMNRVLNLRWTEGGWEVTA